MESPLSVDNDNKFFIQHQRRQAPVHRFVTCLFVVACLTGCTRSIAFVVDEGSDITLSGISLLPDEVLSSSLEGGASGTARINVNLFSLSASGTFTIDELRIAGTEFASLTTGLSLPTGTICVAPHPDLDSGGTLSIPSIFNQNDVDVTIDLNTVNFLTGLFGNIVAPVATNSMLEFNISEGPPPPTTTVVTDGILEGAEVVSNVILVEGTVIETPLIQSCDAYLARVERHGIAGVINARPARILPSRVKFWSDELWYADEKGVHLLMEPPNGVKLDAAHLFERTGEVWFSCNSSCTIDDVRYSAGDIIKYTPHVGFDLQYSVETLFGYDRGFETNIDALAVDAQGRLYYSTHVIPEGKGELTRLDPMTGVFDVIVGRTNLDNGVVDAVALGEEAGEQVLYLSVNHARSIDFATIIKVNPNDLPGRSEVPEIFMRSTKIVENGKEEDLSALAIVLPRGWDPDLSPARLDVVRPAGINSTRPELSVFSGMIGDPIQVGDEIMVEYTNLNGDGSPGIFDQSFGQFFPISEPSGLVELNGRPAGTYSVEFHLRGRSIAKTIFVVEPWGGENDPSTFLQVRDTYRCLTVEEQAPGIGTVADDAAVLQLDCEGKDHQRWITQDAGAGYVRLLASHSGDCLENRDGDVVQAACTDAPNQHWAKDSLVPGFFHLRSRADNQCLDINGHSKSNGARAITNACRANFWTQRWRDLAVGAAITAPAVPPVSLQVRDTYRCLGVRDSALGDGVQVRQLDCTDTDEQHWVPTEVDEEYQTFAAIHSGDCLENRDGDVVQAACTDAPNQHWAKDSLVPGFFHLRSRVDNRCLDIKEHSKSNGAVAIMNTCQANFWTQRWRELATESKIDRRQAELSGLRLSTIRSRNTDQCLTIPSGALGDGIQAIQATCEESVDHQRWVILGDRGAEDVRLQAVHSGDCLESRDGVVVQAACDGSLNQQWRGELLGNLLPDYIHLRSRADDECIDIEGHSRGVGAPAITDTCVAGYWSQQWLFE